MNKGGYDVDTEIVKKFTMETKWVFTMMKK
jgi:hypothetical protein